MSESRSGYQTIESEPDLGPGSETGPDFIPLSEHSLPIEQAAKYRTIKDLSDLGILKSFDKTPGVGEAASQNPGLFLDLRPGQSLVNSGGWEQVGQLYQVLPEPAEALPLEFEDRDRAQELVGFLTPEPGTQTLGDYISFSDSETDRMARSIGTSFDSLDRLIAAHNSRLYFAADPAEATHQALSYGSFELQGREGVPIKCSGDYVKAALDSLGVAGVIYESEATGEAGSGTVYLLDPEGSQNQQQAEAQRRAIAAQLEPTGRSLKSGLEADSPLLNLLNHNLHASPEAVVDAARRVPGFAEIFDADTGVWEGYSLAEHTETVLRNYSQSFAEDMPPNLQNVMKLALLTHDIGKPASLAHGYGDKQSEQAYNLDYSRRFLQQIGVDERAIAYIHGLFEAAPDYTEAYLNADQEGFNAVRDQGSLCLAEIGIEPTAEAVEGFLKATSILFACDGGAYTSVATTRMADGVHHRNAGDFNRSFLLPEDPASKKLQLWPGLEHQPVNPPAGSQPH